MAPSDLAEVEAMVKAAGTSFYRGMRILPPDRRAAMYAIYAFCRLVDDVADEPAPIEAKRAGLAAWRDRDRGRLCRARRTMPSPACWWRPCAPSSCGRRTSWP